MKRSLFLILFISMLIWPVTAQMYDDFNSYNTGVFEKADGWTNGNPFNCTWRADCVSFSGGIMSLIINNDSGSPPYKAGEYRTKNNFSYGLFEVRMKASKAMGTTSTFFTYTGNPWDEIDIEIIWRNSDGSLNQNGILQTNYYTNGTGGHETRVNLSFDASAGFHTYAFEWLPGSIKWYVDGNLVVTETGSRGPLPSTSAQIMMNHWPGIGVDDWLGPFNGQVPKTAQYDWVRYTPAGSTTPAPTVTNPPAITNPPSSGSNNLVVRARGTNGDEQIRLKVSNSTIATFNLNTSYSNYTASTDNSGNISVEFFNDGTDKDVQIDYIQVNGSTRQAEDQSSNTAVWQDSSCGGSYSEWMHCNGEINFGDVSGGTTTPAPTVTNPPAVTNPPTVTNPPSSGGTCTGGTSHSIPFTQDGAGNYCFEIPSINYINSWNMTKLTVNGVDFTNKWASNLPAKINGLYYIVYESNVGWSHFEAR